MDRCKIFVEHNVEHSHRLIHFSRRGRHIFQTTRQLVHRPVILVGSDGILGQRQFALKKDKQLRSLRANHMNTQLPKPPARTN